MQIGSSSSLGDAEDLSDFRMLEAFHIMKDDHCPLAFPEFVEGHSKAASQFIGFCWIAEGRSDAFGEGVGVTHFLSSRDVERSVGHDAMEPRGECLVGKEPIQGTERVEEPFLHGVFGVFVREHDRARDRVCPSLMRLNERGERIGVAALSSKHQLVLALAI